MFYTEAIEGELSIIAVRPDWTSPSHLLGVYSPFAEEFILRLPQRISSERLVRNGKKQNKRSGLLNHMYCYLMK